jgi:hypothetical protein
MTNFRLTFWLAGIVSLLLAAGVVPVATGAEKDGLFWFYRFHPKDAVAEKDRPVKSLHRDVQDVLYVTVMTTAPAELYVTSGGRESAHPLGAGIQHLRIPFSCGAQHFALYRDGRSIISGDGEPIVNRIQRYDFFPTSGFAYAR